ncbi:MAG TPA: ABC transporter ATP-binding protein [Thermoanaerobaculia bacterium]|jgi:ATP-binding cassette subfamily B protein
MRILIPYLLRQWKALALTFFMATINQALTLSEPQILRVVIDRYVMHAQAIDRATFSKGVLTLIGLAVLLALIGRVARNYQEYSITLIARRVGSQLYSKSVAHSLLLPFRTFEDRRAGELLHTMQRARNDAEQAIAHGVRLYLSALAVTLVTIYAFTVHVYIGSLLLLLLPVLAGFMFFITHPVRRHQRRITAETAGLAGSATETIRNVEMVKSLGIEDQEIARLDATNDQILRLEERKLRTVRIFTFIEGTLMNVARASVLLLMLWLVFEKEITVGEFLTIFLYSQWMFAPLAELSAIVVRHQEASATFDTLGEVLNMPIESKPVENVKVGPLERIGFDRVTLQHPTGRTPAVKDVTIEIRGGETIAFVGPSGAGKSSLVKLLVGLYEPTEGAVTFNGVDIRALNLDDIRRRIGLVAHDTHLFAGTIRDNLLIVRADAGDAECLNAIQRAAATPILDRGGKGLDTRIGEGGLKLSGGERQRIAIARALLRHPELLVFDEATSNLDSITERAISATIREVSATAAKMTIIIAHRLSTVVHADRIIVLSHGEIVEEGTHRELLTRDGLYAALWAEQTAGVAAGER